MTCTPTRGPAERVQWMLDHPPDEPGMCAREVVAGGQQCYSAAHHGPTLHIMYVHCSQSGSTGNRSRHDTKTRNTPYTTGHTNPRRCRMTPRPAADRMAPVPGQSGPSPALLHQIMSDAQAQILAAADRTAARSSRPTGPPLGSIDTFSGVTLAAREYADAAAENTTIALLRGDHWSAELHARSWLAARGLLAESRSTCSELIGVALVGVFTP